MDDFYGYHNLEKLRYAETLAPEQLHNVEGQQENVLRMLSPGKILLLRIDGKEHPVLALILTIFDEYVMLSDKTLQDKIYKTTGQYTKAFIESLMRVDKLLLTSASIVVSPKYPDEIRVFKRFQKDFKKDLSDFTEYKNTTMSSKYFNSFISKKLLPDDVHGQRTDLLIQISENSEKNEIFQKGLYHLATLIYRLEHTKTSEAQTFFKELSLYNKDKLDGIDIMDYGFIDSEILSELQLNGMVLETYLFKTFLAGSKYLSFMLEMYKIYKENQEYSEKRSEFIKYFKMLSDVKRPITMLEKEAIQAFALDKVDLFFIHLLE